MLCTEVYWKLKAHLLKPHILYVQIDELFPNDIISATRLFLAAVLQSNSAVGLLVMDNLL